MPRGAIALGKSTAKSGGRLLIAATVALHVYDVVAARADPGGLHDGVSTTAASRARVPGSGQTSGLSDPRLAGSWEVSSVAWSASASWTGSRICRR
jgi:hypothetical protein